MITFLRDANGAAAHADSQSVDTSVDQILSLGCCNHCEGKKM